MSEIKIEEFRKKREAFLVALWLSIPFQIKAMTKGKLKKDGYVTGDADLADIVLCKSKKDLAKKLKISEQIIIQWERNEDFKGLVAQLSKANNVSRFKHDIDLGFTRKTMKTADAQRVKLWYQIFEGWKEGVDLNAKFLPFQIVIHKQSEKKNEKEKNPKGA